MMEVCTDENSSRPALPLHALEGASGVNPWRLAGTTPLSPTSIHNTPRGSAGKHTAKKVGTPLGSRTVAETAAACLPATTLYVQPPAAPAATLAVSAPPTTTATAIAIATTAATIATPACTTTAEAAATPLVAMSDMRLEDVEVTSTAPHSAHGLDEATQELCSLFAADVTTLADLFDPLRDERYQDAMEECEAGLEGEADTEPTVGLPNFWDTWCGVAATPTPGPSTLSTGGAGTGAGATAPAVTAASHAPGSLVTVAPVARAYTSGVRNPVACLLDTVDSVRCNTPTPSPQPTPASTTSTTHTGRHGGAGLFGSSSAFRRWERRA